MRGLAKFLRQLLADFWADQHVFAPWGKELADEKKPYIKGENRGTPGGIRTPNLLIRSQMHRRTGFTPDRDVVCHDKERQGSLWDSA